MSGIAIIVQLLLADAGVTELVDAANIMGDDLPSGTPLPAIGVMRVGKTKFETYSKGATRHYTDRVQATIMGRNRPEVDEILTRVEAAGDDKRPTMAGLSDIVVRTDGAGPDFGDDASAIRFGTYDFIVSWNQPT